MKEYIPGEPDATRDTFAVRVHRVDDLRLDRLADKVYAAIAVAGGELTPSIEGMCRPVLSFLPCAVATAATTVVVAQLHTLLDTIAVLGLEPIVHDYRDPILDELRCRVWFRVAR